MRKQWITGLIVMVVSGTWAETVTNNLDMQGGFIYNHGVINPGDMGLTFTNAGIRDITVSAGQLSGIDPETGAIITNAANLLSLKVESLTTASNITAGGKFVGNGSGLTNLNATNLTGRITTANMPSSGTWNASGVTITNVKFAGNIQVAGSSLNVATNLTVQGTISGSGSNLTNVAAGGRNGEAGYPLDASRLYR
jgi:hypothetical protein